METSVAAASFLEFCRLRNLSPKTIESYKWALKHLRNYCSELPDDHRPLMHPLGNPNLGQESRHDLDRVLRRFFKWASDEYGRTNPMLRIERVKRKKSLPRVLTQKQIETVWESCDNDRDLGLVALVLDTGIRLGELAQMRKQDMGSRTLRVSGKIGDRQLPITPELRVMLMSLGDDAYYWLSYTTWLPLTYDGLKRVFTRVLKRAGVVGPKLGPHLLRHTFGTEYCRSGGNVRILQEIMGHERLETTMIYVHLAGAAVAQDHARHSPFRQLIDPSTSAA